MKARVKSKGLRDVMKKLAKLGSEKEISLAAVKATAKGGVFLRDKAKTRCYVAAAPYTVTYQGRRVTLMPGTLADEIIVKRIPQSELKGGLTAMHIVTVRQKDDAAANIGKIANIYESRHPFLRPTAQANGEQAKKLAITSLEKDVINLWTR